MTLLAPSFSRGFALCTPEGEILGHSYRPTADEAVACRLPRRFGREARWARLTARGWSVQAVYARVWVPLFHVSNPDQIPETEEISHE